MGFKPAGGIRTAKESLAWLSLVKEELGDEWLTPDLFRIGASSLLSDIERQVSEDTRSLAGVEADRDHVRAEPPPPASEAEQVIELRCKFC